MKHFFKEFKEFISRGNVMDMAVGVIIGGAFSAIVASLVNDVVTPVIAFCTAGLDFSTLCIKIGDGENAASLNYGSFIQAIINFLVISIVVFILIKIVNKIIRKKEKAEDTKVCPYCKETIAIDAKRCPHCTSELD